MVHIIDSSYNISERNAALYFLSGLDKVEEKKDRYHRIYIAIDKGGDGISEEDIYNYLMAPIRTAYRNAYPTELGGASDKMVDRFLNHLIDQELYLPKDYVKKVIATEYGNFPELLKIIDYYDERKKAPRFSMNELAEKIHAGMLIASRDTASTWKPLNEVQVTERGFSEFVDHYITKWPYRLDTGE